jgi:hypothetical protein
MAYKTVFLAAFPAMELLWDRRVVSDANGYYQFYDLRAVQPTSGDWGRPHFAGARRCGFPSPC